MDKSYTVSEVANKLNISDKTLRRWEEAGRFRSSRSLGNQRRYSIEDIQILDAIKHGAILNQSELLTKQDAARLCGVAEVTIDRWEKEGKIHPFITVGLTYYPRAQLIQKLPDLKNGYLEEELEPLLLPNLGDLAPTIVPNPVIKSRPLSPVPSLPPKANPLTLTSVSKLVSREVLLNALITLLILFVYHFLFTSSPSKLISPQPVGSVQGITTTSSPSLDLLSNILDPSGALTTTTITARTGLITPSLAFNPTSAPSNPTPGTIYYDALSQTLKIWKSSAWVDLTSTQTISAKDGTLITSTAIIPKGKNQVTVNSENISPTTPITVTFKTDYSPAKKYWLETNQGSFTLHTDFPVSSDAPFNYFILSNNLTAAPVASSTPITR